MGLRSFDDSKMIQTSLSYISGVHSLRIAAEPASVCADAPPRTWDQISTTLDM
jgi:hypothetical protein